MGERFSGRYELLDPLGEGGMASVWRVWDDREQRVVAAKVLRQSDAVSLLRFVREQAVRVASPHVLTPLGWAGEDDRVLFTMPIVDGGSAASLVGDYGPLPPALVVELLRQLLQALTTVHDARLVHRDVKPANLLLVATGRGRPHLLLSDFGIAVDLDGPRLTHTGGFVGTPGFVAPETFSGAEPSAQADLYAAGQVGLHLLSGAEGRADEPAARRPPAVTDAVWRLLLDLTAEDPAARPRSARAALTRLGPAPPEWDEAALGDVEIFAHVGADPAGRPQLLAGTVDGRSAPPATDGPSSRGQGVAPTRPATPAPGVPRRRRVGPLVAVTVLAVLGVAALVMAWSPWSTAEPTRPPPATAPVTTVPTPRASATSGATSGASSGATSGARSGTVSVGTVVSGVGQPCEFVQVDARETTTAGTPVVCQRRSDGSYAWDPPPG